MLEATRRSRLPKYELVVELCAKMLLNHHVVDERNQKSAREIKLTLFVNLEGRCWNSDLSRDREPRVMWVCLVVTEYPLGSDSNMSTGITQGISQVSS